jgi:MFS transporter, DHA2 family, multidrug resistance protein
MAGMDTDEQLRTPRAGRREWLGLAVLALPTILLGLDMTVLHLAAPVLSLAGATLMPSTLSLISNMFRDPRQRQTAIAIWMTNFMIGGMAGPLIGGVLLEHFWWGSVFLIGVPPLLILLATSRALLSAVHRLSVPVSRRGWARPARSSEWLWESR